MVDLDFLFYGCFLNNNFASAKKSKVVLRLDRIIINVITLYFIKTKRKYTSKFPQTV